MGLPAAVRDPWLWTEQGSPGMATMTVPRPTDHCHRPEG